MYEVVDKIIYNEDETISCPYCQGEGKLCVMTGMDTDALANCSACYGDGFFEPWETIPDTLPPLIG